MQAGGSCFCSSGKKIIYYRQEQGFSAGQKGYRLARHLKNVQEENWNDILWIMRNSRTAEIWEGLNSFMAKQYISRLFESKFRLQEKQRRGEKRNTGDHDDSAGVHLFSYATVIAGNCRSKRLWQFLSGILWKVGIYGRILSDEFR